MTLSFRDTPVEAGGDDEKSVGQCLEPSVGLPTVIGDVRRSSRSVETHRRGNWICVCGD